MGKMRDGVIVDAVVVVGGERAERGSSVLRV